MYSPKMKRDPERETLLCKRSIIIAVDVGDVVLGF